MNIGTAVTTAPREGVDYLPATLESITAAGFGNLTIFAEPGSTLPPGFLVEHAETRLHAWPAFLRAVESLLRLWPDAGGVAVFQDDIVLARGLAEWLPRQPVAMSGVISLFTPAALSDGRDPGWHTTPTELMPNRVPGAPAIVMPRWAARKLLDEPPIGADKKPVTRHVRGTGTDLWLALWCKQHGLQYMFYVPSLVRHIGATSAVDRGFEPGLGGGWRREGEFAEDVREFCKTPVDNERPIV